MNGQKKTSELLILNSASSGPFPVDCFFRLEREYRLCFGEPWHGYTPNECWLAIADLINQGLLEVIKKIDREKSTDDFTSEMVCLGLTPSGGRLWEKSFHVDWDAFVWTEAIADGATVQAEYQIRAANGVLLLSMIEELKKSKFSQLFVLSGVDKELNWQWSNWKSFACSYKTRIGITAVEASRADYYSAEDFLFDVCRRISLNFKKTGWPITE